MYSYNLETGDNIICALVNQVYHRYPQIAEIIVIMFNSRSTPDRGHPVGSSGKRRCDPRPEETWISTLPPMERFDQAPAFGPGPDRNGGHASKSAYTLLDNKPVKSATYR